MLLVALACEPTLAPETGTAIAARRGASRRGATACLGARALLPPLAGRTTARIGSATRGAAVTTRGEATAEAPRGGVAAWAILGAIAIAALGGVATRGGVATLDGDAVREGPAARGGVATLGGEGCTRRGVIERGGVDGAWRLKERPGGTAERAGRPGPSVCGTKPRGPGGGDCANMAPDDKSTAALEELASLPLRPMTGSAVLLLVAAPSADALRMRAGGGQCHSAGSEGASMTISAKELVIPSCELLLVDIRPPPGCASTVGADAEEAEDCAGACWKPLVSEPCQEARFCTGGVASESLLSRSVLLLSSTGGGSINPSRSPRVFGGGGKAEPGSDEEA